MMRTRVPVYALNGWHAHTPDDIEVVADRK
jgi:hypothetical protein